MRHPRLNASLKRCQALLTKRSVLSVVALLGVLFSANCGDMPTSPTEFAGPNSELSTAAVKPGFSYSPEWTVSQPMTTAGGSIALDGNDVVTSFPSGALPVDSTTITANMKLNAPRGSATRIEFDFQPSMTFQKPVKLIIANRYLAGTSPKFTLWYFDPQSSKWVLQADKVVPAGEPVVFDIYHYSGYAVSR